MVNVYWKLEIIFSHEQENWTGVIEECTKAIDLNQRYVKALHRRAKAFDKIGKKENCLEGNSITWEAFSAFAVPCY